ncbi:glycoside hydrolase family 97 catalytic domain-containing protein [Halocatena halophila]|uniref:glycoside hydrolase family 97 catalytic domain-containing protein n=1 Tax=Halocatena halophila TaxID=2814576 RepID=UPI002ED0FB85
MSERGNGDCNSRTWDGRAVDRRSVLTGMAGLLGATAYSLEVSETVGAQITSGDDSNVQSVSSPDGSITVTVDVSSGVPTYSIEYNGTTYVEPSPLGFNFASQETFGTGVSGSGPEITVTGSESVSSTEVWEPVWGDFDHVSEDYTLLRLGIEETATPVRSATLEVKVFDDGLGLRIIFDDDFGDFTITSENTEFRFSSNYTCWYIENQLTNPRYEQEYTKTKISNAPAGERTSGHGNTIQRGTHTPLTMDAGDGTYLSIHESNLADYAKMTLGHASTSTNFFAELAPDSDGTKVTATAPHLTPWRTFQIGDSPGDLIESQLISLLAAPLDSSAFNDDTSWISGRKYAGIWWTMIAGSANWEYKSDAEIEDNGNDPAQYIHGARTQRMMRYMRFASENGIDSVLAEGWNTGWSDFPCDGTGFEFGVAESYPDFDVKTVTDYGQSLSNPVEMMMHNETSGNLPNYEGQIHNDVFVEYNDNDIHTIKNGYVCDQGLGIDGDGSTADHNNFCQQAVNHNRFVYQVAASNKQMLECHEALPPTGEIRTYPNVVAREVVKAQEFDGFDELGSDVGRDHHVTLPYTRMLAGPTSFQPGIFDITFNDNSVDRIQTTRAKQLAMYPSYLAGNQMIADRIEAYVNHEFGVGEFVQAQSGQLNEMITADKWRNCFGGHYVPIDPNREPSGATVSVTVNVPQAGDYDLHIRYAADQENNSDRVQNNGSPEATLRVNSSTSKLTPVWTSYWDVWAIHTETVSLNAGDNEIAIELHYDSNGNSWSGDVGGFNVNTIGVTKQDTAAPFPAEFTDYDGTNAAAENFEPEPEFTFLKDVPASWDETVHVNGQIGDYTVSAKRKDNEWYIGAMTNGDSRAVDVTLDFIASKSNGWNAEMYEDADGTDVTSNPTEVAITRTTVQNGDTLTLSLPASGGTAIRLWPA